MSVEIIMPELGESVHEATLSKWLKQEGDRVQEDEPIVEIMTDKVNTELPAPASGILAKILIPEGNPVHVFKPMGVIAEEGEQISASTATEAKDEKRSEVASNPTASSSPTELIGDRKWFTPLVRSIAREHNISEQELSSISGSGTDRRVTKRDIESYIAQGPSRPASISQPAPAPKVELKADQQIIPLVGMRKMIADAMIRSSQIPTVSTLMEVDVTNLVDFRATNKETFEKQFGVKLTYTPFFVKTIAEALQEFPMVNASLQPDNNILISKGVHLGIAVALGAKGEDGLIVPVIRDCQNKHLGEIAKEIDSLAKKARSNSLGVSDIQGGTFTLTNPGTYGALLGTPMINAPQAGILGAYAIKKVPMVINDMIAIRSVMNIVLTYDHRIIDGMLAGKFLQSIKKKLETFDFYK